MRVDLHIHSRFSDSSKTIEEVMKEADEKNIDYISFVDHDTTETIDYVRKIQDKFKVRVLPGVEISAYDFKRKRKVHILCYNYRKTDHIESICSELLDRRNKNSMAQIYKLTELGYEIDKDKLIRSINSKRTLYKQHIMDYICDYDFNDERYTKLYKSLFKNGGPLQMDIEYVDAFDALKACLLDGGIPVLAHPGELDSFEIAEELAKEGLKGIEVEHFSHSPEDVERAKDLAKKYDLIQTSGSDDHGRFGKKADMGYEVLEDSHIERLISD